VSFAEKNERTRKNSEEVSTLYLVPFWASFVSFGYDRFDCGGQSRWVTPRAKTFLSRPAITFQLSRLPFQPIEAVAIRFCVFDESARRQAQATTKPVCV
jgi:hypothetical protein